MFVFFISHHLSELFMLEIRPLTGQMGRLSIKIWYRCAIYHPGVVFAKRRIRRVLRS